MKILLLGTSEFAYIPFKNIIDHFDVVGIVCQPDAKSNRGMKLSHSPIKKLAIENKIKIFQPKKISSIYDELKKINFDILLTCSYGQFIPDKILNLSKIASLNIHASLLPKYRGAAPIHYALINNESITGISLIYMIKKMDAGDILFQEKITINKDDTFSTLFTRLSFLAGDKIIEWLPLVINNSFIKIIQNENEVTFAPKITKDFFEIKTSDTTKNILNKIRIFSSCFSVYLFKNNIRYKIFSASDKFSNGSIEYKLADGSIFITELQPENKKRMFSNEFLKGNKF